MPTNKSLPHGNIIWSAILPLRFAIIAGILLAALIAAPVPVRATPCDQLHKNPAEYQQVLKDALKPAETPTTATFSTRVLPGGDRIRLAIRRPYANWKAEVVCGIVIWNNADATNCKPDASHICQPFGTIAASGDPDDTNQTILHFTVPVKKNGWAPYRRPAELRIVSYEGTEEKLGFSFTEKIAISGRERSALIAIGFAVFFFIFLIPFLAARGARQKDDQSYRRMLNPVRLTAGIFRKASLSRFQIYLFTAITSTLVVYTWCRTGVLFNISNDLLILMGLSAAGAAGGKLTAVTKKRASADVRVYLIEKQWMTPPTEAIDVTDLVLTDGALNVYKFQMAIFTIVVAFVVVTSGISETGIIEIPETYLALLGLSQAVYVGGKAVSESDVKKFEGIIQEMQKKETEYLDTPNAPQPTKGDDLESFEQKVKTKSAKIKSAKIKNAYNGYAKAAKTARLAFQELYDVGVPNDRLLPGR